MQEGVSFAKLDFDAGERFVRLRAELGIESFGLNLLLLEPGQGGRIHRHERQEEAYVVLEGTLTLELDGGEVHTLTYGDVARVAPDGPASALQPRRGAASRCSRWAVRSRTRGATASPTSTGTTPRARRRRTCRCQTDLA